MLAGWLAGWRGRTARTEVARGDVASRVFGGRRAATRRRRGTAAVGGRREKPGGRRVAVGSRVAVRAGSVARRCKDNRLSLKIDNRGVGEYRLE